MLDFLRFLLLVVSDCFFFWKNLLTFFNFSKNITNTQTLTNSIERELRARLSEIPAAKLANEELFTGTLRYRDAWNLWHVREFVLTIEKLSYYKTEPGQVSEKKKTKSDSIYLFSVFSFRFVKCSHDQLRKVSCCCTAVR